ncbi:uncharacterized protein STEHIDRAFT_97896 [Stereum hirsutum FP-91666 SS1]|uniref:uncharacterized protein n=1 Tax=Stereum hirsutum (strain FP-91666) TaxID=721885 RepID=UPI000444A172|nr:uncharacterized protein STEHIDRAFT_97896 [Stereum hirsutum FP-91666 SS1]EIM85744.1 hypothetical protein STEHIDRAFT_97896 [Stereum hirsutum FP-91666 SS1]
MTAESSPVDDDFLSSVEGEISFFRSLMRTRPVGLHRHFHILSMRNAIYRDTGRHVSIEDLWEKLRSCYDLDALENLETEGYESPGSSSPTPHQARSPSPSENLWSHPFFRKEFELPWDEEIISILDSRRLRGPEDPASPASPPPPTKRGRGKKRTRSDVATAGLIGGDSDSSALTQESGDESALPTPRESATDGGTDYADEDEESVETAKPTKKGKSTKKGASTRRASTSRPAKKRKR